MELGCTVNTEKIHGSFAVGGHDKSYAMCAVVVFLIPFTGVGNNPSIGSYKWPSPFSCCIEAHMESHVDDVPFQTFLIDYT